MICTSSKKLTGSTEAVILEAFGKIGIKERNNRSFRVLYHYMPRLNELYIQRKVFQTFLFCQF
ncbi:hypothetical protein [Metabacillus fastidiosus]|uniref:hypothetical protein n=1 Tax=Metabacillus fastidiosus TaxID=1458 RepID=UPI003D2CB73D